MSALTTAAYIVGSALIVASGFAVAAGLLWLAAKASGKYAWRLWGNLSSIYKVHTMEYWFRRMQKDGTHVLRKAHEEKMTEAQCRKTCDICADEVGNPWPCAKRRADPSQSQEGAQS